MNQRKPSILPRPTTLGIGLPFGPLHLLYVSNFSYGPPETSTPSRELAFP